MRLAQRLRRAERSWRLRCLWAAVRDNDGKPTGKVLLRRTKTRPKILCSQVRGIKGGCQHLRYDCLNAPFCLLNPSEELWSGAECHKSFALEA